MPANDVMFNLMMDSWLPPEQLQEERSPYYDPTDTIGCEAPV